MKDRSAPNVNTDALALLLYMPDLHRIPNPRFLLIIIVVSIIHHINKSKTTLDTKLQSRTSEIKETNKLLRAEINKLIRKKKELSKINKKLIENQESFRSAFSYASIGMALVSLEGRWVKINKSFCNLLGYTEEELVKIDFQTLTHPDDLETDLKFIKQLLERKLNTYQMEKRYFHKDGHIVWVMLSVSLVRDDHGIPLYFISQVQDIQKQKEAEGQLLYQASHDVLTGLYNRNQLELLIENALSNAKTRRDKRLIAILFLDLDNFKRVNDTLGHICGDQLLIEVSWRLGKVLRKEDVIARFGGDEFTIMLQGLDTKSEIEIAIDKILKEIVKPYCLNNETVYISASIGIACFPEAGDNLTDLLRNADLSLLQAKESGKNKFEFYSEKIGKLHQTEFMLEKALREAIPNHELFLMYQPKFNLLTRQIIGIEALLRWQHPEFGLIMPDKFIHIAEKSNLIVTIGQWVMETAFKQLDQWRKAFNDLPLTLAINLSPHQLNNIHFIENVKRLLRDMKIPANKLEFELTESALMQHAQHQKILNHLRDLAVQVVIDDFGTGHSFLYQLNDLPISTIKIDGSFIQGIELVKGNAAIVKSIINLGKDLGLNVIAEGIETKPQYDFLLTHGCLQGLGHYLSQPLNLDEVVELMNKNES
ncbi:MAG: putative bifunctional diguanylate cyclase/phosphodiesterase [Gammaproteobacteria bacterium]